MQNIKLNTALSIIKQLSDNGFQAFFAGGYVRDKLLGLSDGEDIDIATNATPSQIKSLFNRVVGVGEHFGVMLVIENNIPFEVATFRSDEQYSDGRHPDHVVFSDPMEDARRRDLTINGLFFDPGNSEILDYVNGREDLKNQIIRTIGDPVLRFQEDYLRLLRTVRFAARFAFSIEKHTWQALKVHADKILVVSRERIFQELNKMLLGPSPEKAISLLDESGLLKVILPEVHLLKGVEQPEEFHPEGDVFIHTIQTLSYLKNPTQTTVWSALLHDIGKPATQKFSDRIRFNNHHRVGALKAKKVLQRLKCSRTLINEVFDCVDNHMNFMNVSRMRLSTLKKFLSRSTLNDELELHKADCLASHGNIDNYTFLQEQKKVMEAKAIQPEPLIKGKDLIELGLKPGSIFGVILNQVYDLQLEETIVSAQGAIDWVRDHYKEFLQS